MSLQRIQRKISRTPLENDTLRRLRERFSREKPSAEALIKSGEVEEFLPLGSFLSLQETLLELKRLRKSVGLSLSEVAKASRIDKAALSRLENGLQPNPKLATLDRYARAVRAEIVLSVRKLRGRVKPER